MTRAVKAISALRSVRRKAIEQLAIGQSGDGPAIDNRAELTSHSHSHDPDAPIPVPVCSNLGSRFLLSPAPNSNPCNFFLIAISMAVPAAVTIVRFRVSHRDTDDVQGSGQAATGWWAIQRSMPSAIMPNVGLCRPGFVG